MSVVDEAAYTSAREGAALFRSRGRRALRIWGREPAQMLSGITTGRIPEPPRPGSGESAGSGHRSEWAYSTILTPKGRMVSDLRVVALAEDDPAFALDLPAAGAEPVQEHLKKVLPPRFARAEEWERDLSTLVGPEAATALAAAVSAPAAALAELEDGAALHLADGTVILRTSAAPGTTLEVWHPRATGNALVAACLAAGAVEGSPEVWETLRVEAGRPEFGLDMGPDTIPTEAGIADRAVDHTKGCYTGQEVIVRIRDRGHVNRHLRGLRFESAAPQPPAGTELFSADTGKQVGRITSVVESPVAGGALGLGYVRREVDPGGAVRVGLPVGPLAEVRELGDGWWLAAT